MKMAYLLLGFLFSFILAFAIEGKLGSLVMREPRGVWVGAVTDEVRIYRGVSDDTILDTILALSTVSIDGVIIDTSILTKSERQKGEIVMDTSDASITISMPDNDGNAVIKVERGEEHSIAFIRFIFVANK